MGVFKKYVGGLAIESANCSIRNMGGGIYAHDTIPFITSDGTSLGGSSNYGIYCGGNDSNQHGSIIPYYNLTPYASAEALDDYNIDAYTVSDSIGTVTASKASSFTDYSKTLTFTITIVAEASEITVNSIKFKKTIKVYVNGTADKTLLICAYYLDSPLTIPAGESRTITIEMKVGTDISVS